MILQWSVGRHAKYKRGSGFTLLPNQPVSYITGRGMGWYRYKRDAVKRAEELNACEAKRGTA